jgi:hypothetical protein
MQNLAPFLLLHVYGETLLVPVEPDVARRQAANHFVPVPDEVPDSGALDLDDLRPHIREDTGAERAGQDLLERNHANAVERAGRVFVIWTHL